MTATRPPQHGPTPAPQHVPTWWEDAPTVALPVQKPRSTTRWPSTAVQASVGIVVLLVAVVVLGLVVTPEPVAAPPAAAPTAPESPQRAFVNDVLDTPGLTSTMPSNDMLRIGESACAVMAYQQYTRDDLIAALGQTKLGPDVMGVMIDAAQRNLCPQYAFPTVTTASTGGGNSAAPAAPIPAGPLTTVGDGTYQVGTDLVAGRYKTTGPITDSSCYLERSKDDSGELTSIISNDNISGPGSITVKAGEFVKFSGDCTWTKQ